MAKIKIGKEEIEKMLKDQLRVAEVKWDKKGNAEVEIELQAITEKKEEHRYYPIYIKPCQSVWTPMWTSGTMSSGVILTYSSSNTGVPINTTSLR